MLKEMMLNEMTLFEDLCILNYWTLFLSKDCLFLIFTLIFIRMSFKLLMHLCQHFYWKCHLKFGILCHISLPKEIGQFTENVL